MSPIAIIMLSQLQVGGGRRSRPRATSRSLIAEQPPMGSSARRRSSTSHDSQVMKPSAERDAKRVANIVMFKRESWYIAFTGALAVESRLAPLLHLEPDPLDRTISKRGWEHHMANWKATTNDAVNTVVSQWLVNVGYRRAAPSDCSSVIHSRYCGVEEVEPMYTADHIKFKKMCSSTTPISHRVVEEEPMYIVARSEPAYIQDILFGRLKSNMSQF